MTKERIDVIQAIRWIAALLVVFYHRHTRLIIAWRPIGKFLFSSGSAGVDLFFVISGFIMAYVSHSLPSWITSTRKFILERIIRIVPLYYLSTLWYLIITKGANWNYLPNLFNSLAFIPTDFLTMWPYYGYPTLVVWRTLNYEMIFYMIFWLTLFVKSTKRFWYLIWIFSIFLIWVPLATWQLPSLHAEINYWPQLWYLNLLSNPMIWEFLAWTGIYLLLQFIPKPISKFLIYWSIVLSWCIFLVQYLFKRMPNHWLAWWGFGAILLISSILLMNKYKPIRVHKALIRLGNISYSVYLLHLPIFILAEKFFQKIWRGEFAGWPLFLFWSISVILFISTLSYNLIEIKATHRIKKKLAKFLI